MSEMEAITVSREAELDREIEKLIGKIVDGDASASERDQYERISQMRIRMMQPKAVARHEARQNRR